MIRGGMEERGISESSGKGRELEVGKKVAPAG